MGSMVANSGRTAQADAFISVVVPTWNRAAHLRDLLASLAGQDYPPDRFEIVVVDDGSTDRTAEVVRAVASLAVPHVRYVPQEHRGYCAACNTGVSAASGEVVCFLDSDEMVPPTHLSGVWER